MSHPVPTQDYEQPCKNHEDRAGTLAVDLPSLGLRRYLCAECRATLTANLSSYKGKREAWDHAAYDYQRFGRDLYTRTAGGWRCEAPTTDERRWK